METTWSQNGKRKNSYFVILQNEDKEGDYINAEIQDKCNKRVKKKWLHII